MYAIKVHLKKSSKVLRFARQKTMYGGRKITVGDTIYVFDSENEGGQGLAFKGVVTKASAVPPKTGVERQTPLVNVEIRITGIAKRPLGRDKLKTFTNWKDEKPETELNFKFYRQATNKIVGISEKTAKFLSRFF